MKKLFLGLMIILLVLPQMSFGATQASVETNPQVTAFLNQQQAEALAFYQQQGIDTKQFIQDHPDIMEAQDKIVKAWVVQHNVLVQQAKLTGGPMPSGVLPSITDPTFAAFVAKQQSDKAAFFGAQAQAKQKFLSSLGSN